MINNLLNAYEETRRQNGVSFFKAIKRAGVVDQIYLIIFLICNITMIITSVLNKIKILLFILVVLMVATTIWVIHITRNERKKWSVNIYKYQDDLNTLKEILSKPEFNMYEKNKLKQLICKCKVDIDNLEKENLEVKKSYSGFLGGYIVPVFAFGMGKLSQEMTSEDLFAACLGVIALLVFAKMIINGIWIMKTEIVEGNEIERKHCFVKKLQDLLDRDFPIEEKDLL